MRTCYVVPRYSRTTTVYDNVKTLDSSRGIFAQVYIIDPHAVGSHTHFPVLTRIYTEKYVLAASLRPHVPGM